MIIEQIGIVLVFIVVGGLFAMAEIALVSLRPSQVARMAASGRAGRTVERLLASPNRFLSAVQIGVTLATLLSSAFGAENFADPVSAWLVDLGLPAAAARAVAIIGVTLLVAYASLVLGELAPKRIAMQRAESIALVVAGPIDVIAKVTGPVIWLLGVSSDLLVRMLGGDPKEGKEVMTEQELREIVATNDHLTTDERHLIAEVLDAGDRPLREVMVPRLDVSVLPADATVGQALVEVRDQPFSRYPVVDGGLDDTVGFVHVRDLYSAHERLTAGTTLREVARPVGRQPDSRRALPTLAQMRREGMHLAVVVDEYGGGAGIVTLEDLLEELVGDITDEFDPGHRTMNADRPPRGATPGEGLPDAPVDAQLRLDEFEETTGVRLPPGPYDTAAGWVLHALGRIPAEGDHADFGTVRITVTTMRSRRVAEVHLAPVETPADGAPAGHEAPAAAEATQEGTPADEGSAMDDAGAARARG